MVGNWCGASADCEKVRKVIERREIRDPEGLGKVSKTATQGEERGNRAQKGRWGGRTCWEQVINRMLRVRRSP